ncbi:unnamed protein product [Cyclocybe aegerita]|uniref:Uncharacterized protein n=1 Tax=Cyclocybe aegerita TaxID=1973307 RepID=A0A8S0X2Y0_CYCAE|nr:unnamed protein product [Cyclocybe aegerita]
MALTQSARLPGPSWDEEVVPALRQRLQTESRTLAKRLSAISLSSVDEPTSLTYTAYTGETSVRHKQASSSMSSQTPAQRYQASYHQQHSSDRATPTATSRVNGTSKPAATSDYQRTRTYSTPGRRPNGSAQPKLAVTKSSNPFRSVSPRLADVKPTRIPKRPTPSLNISSSSAANSPYLNGYSHGPTGVTPNHGQSPEQSFLRPGADQARLVSSSSTQSTVDLPTRGYRQPVGLLNETPPFPTSSSMSSFSQVEDPPRASMESEEHPFEHWYRGEVSRNGGVGELRVGRRQEMLDIANYGHLIGNKKSMAHTPARVEDLPRYRKRAGSIAGITNKERERGSLYLDDDRANEVGRVLDEHPLTDLEGDQSDVHSLAEKYGNIRGGAYAYLPEEGDITAATSSDWTPNVGAEEMRSTTPTARSSSRQQQRVPPSRIPGPPSRHSSESRSTVTSPPMARTASDSPSISRTPPPPVPSSSSNIRAVSTSPSPSSNASAKQRGVSPGSAKKTPRGAGAAKTRAKIQERKKGDEGKNRMSLAEYPAPPGDEENMADAIPSWTQSVPREGNWDDVVLPVVARKKGLDGYYENADGSPQPKKVEKTVEPAPGTFGFDHTKYREPRNNDEFILMDEFGRPTDQQNTAPEDDAEEAHNRPSGPGPLRRSIQDDGVPIRIPPSPSPLPFSQYAPTSMQTRVNGVPTDDQEQEWQRQQQQMREEKEAGCCKCIVM